MTGANRQLHRQSARNPQSLNHTTGSHVDQNTSILRLKRTDPVNQIALAIKNLAEKIPKNHCFSHKLHYPSTVKTIKREIRILRDLFHTTLRMQPNLTKNIKINHFHAHLRGLAPKTFKNIQKTPTTTFEDILNTFAENT